MMQSVFRTGEHHAAWPSADRLRQVHRTAAHARVVESHIVRLATRGDVKFAIYGTGEEVHGAATATALYEVTDLDKFGIVPHYRSFSLLSTWADLHGHHRLTRDVFRQQFSRDTDRMSRGRQMVQHVVIPELGVLAVQSPVGMQLGKAAGHALGFKKKGVSDALTVAILGDGSTAEGDLHDAMNAASVWDLPLLIIVTDNGVAISTRPDEGRGIKDFSAYAAGFGVRHFTCDGRDFFDSYDVTYQAATHVRDQQRPAMLHVHSLPRFNGHSSAADMSFDLSQEDPLIRFGELLHGRQIVEEQDILRRKPGATGRDFFALHDLGEVMAREDESVRKLIDEVRAEPEPSVDSLESHIYAPFPSVQEPPRSTRATNVTYGSAIRSAIDHIISERGGIVYGQDVARLGGVMQATAGLASKHPGRIFDAPLNEPLIVGTAMGAGLHPEICAMPEIQFGDYALNAFHWLVHLGNLHWSTNGQAKSQVILRMPVDPFGGGAIYHSMSVDGYFTPIPGLVVAMPSTSWDVYGMLLTASEYEGPVVMLEPKALYRQAVGPAFPGEPTDQAGVTELKKASLHGAIPDLPRDIRVPFGKGVYRNRGDDITIVCWGRAVTTALQAAQALAADGISADVIDLRTLVPPDLDLVYESVARTGRAVVAAEDRAFAGFARTIQGHVAERFPGSPTAAVGQKNLPGIAQSLRLESATVLNRNDIVGASKRLIETDSKPVGFGWIPRRYHVA